MSVDVCIFIPDGWHKAAIMIIQIHLIQVKMYQNGVGPSESPNLLLIFSMNRICFVGLLL